jgi:hypothetical protein
MFKPFADFYYEQSPEKREEFAKDFIGKYVHWSGTVVEVWKKKIVIFGGDNYGNESWSDMGFYDSLNHMLPYTFIAASNEVVSRYKKGSKISVTGKIVSRGDKDLFLHWKLEDIQVVSVEEPA